MLSAGIALALAWAQGGKPVLVELRERSAQQFVLPADTQGSPATTLYTYVSRVAGKVTVQLQTADFLPLIQVRDNKDHAVNAVGTEGKLETILTTTAAAGERLMIEVGTADGWTGSFQLNAQNGDAYSLAPKEELDRWIDLHELGAETGGDNQDYALEAHHRLALASTALQRGERARAQAELDRVLNMRARLEPIRAPPSASRRPRGTYFADRSRPALTPRERAVDVLYQALRMQARLELEDKDAAAGSECLDQALRIGLQYGVLHRCADGQPEALNAYVVDAANGATDVTSARLVCEDLLNSLGEHAEVLGEEGQRAILTGLIAESGPVLPRTLRAMLWQKRADLDAEAGICDEAARGYTNAIEASSDAEQADLQRMCFGRMGEVLSQQGRYTQSMRSTRACLDRTLERALNKDMDGETAVALLSLGNQLSALGEHEESIRALEAGLEFAASQEGAPTRMEILITLGYELKALERPLESRARLTVAQGLANGLGDANALARTWLGLVETYDPKKEQEQRHKILAEAESAISAQHDADLDAYFLATKSWALYLEGDAAAALSLARDASERFRVLGNTEEQVHALSTVVVAATALGDQHQARSELDRGTLILERWAGQLSSEHAASLRRAYREWATVQQDLITLEIARAGTDAQAADLARGEGLRMAQHWKNRSLVDSVAQPESAQDFGVARLREALKDPRTWLVEYVNGSEALYAYVVGPSFFTRIELGPWKTLEDQAAEFVHTVSERTDAASSRQIATLGHALYLRLVAPALAALPPGGAAPHRLILVPTLGLSVLPFDALLTRPVPENTFRLSFSEWPFLVRELEIDYVPSSALLVLLSGREPRKGPSKTLIVASSHYTRDPDSASRGAGIADSLGDLPMALEEARSIVGALYVRETPEVKTQLESFVANLAIPPKPVQGSTLALYVNQHATRKCLQQADASYSQIYCITHGEVDLEYPERTGLVLAPGPAGYERFTCADLEKVSLDADVVVLSACSTALGKPLRGEGIQSLANAFLKANARAVIATLWQVQDDSTKLLFGTQHFSAGDRTAESFHQAVADGIVSPARALHEAKQFSWTRKRGSSAAGEMTERPRRVDSADPYFWAAFVYVGTVR